MLNQPTIDKLLAMRVEPVVEAWRAFEQDETRTIRVMPYIPYVRTFCIS
jgi:hypothetical protein